MELDRVVCAAIDNRYTRETSGVEENKSRCGVPIAVVGLGCQFPPDCRDPESYRSCPEAGGDASTPFSPGRCAGEPSESLPGGFLRGTRPWGFDAPLFGLSPREVTAIEDAGRPAGKLRGAAIAASGRTHFIARMAVAGSAAAELARSLEARQAEAGLEFPDELEPDEKAARIERDTGFPGAQ